ncbi:MAG: Eco29kI family restriction endonuclease [Candidatus Nanopelagicales bacterium]|nr:Eco29kI family restriction endonuclease [Candidatus Nanopelagicales bacterium]MDZ4249030.1 Eco29kI family restriction endonuclease [Candidatus Nanopelagicales bacterium]
MSKPFNPLDIENLGASVAQALAVSEATPFAELDQFEGAGIYAVYYTGPFPSYALLSEANRESYDVPIYAGKAVPKGSRKGLLAAPQSRALCHRLRQHRRSIEMAENLELEDFGVRWLVVEQIWIPLGESLLINRSAPLWNALIDGFGNHDTGSGRHAGVRSRWDVLHPGRAWANNLQPRPETSEEIQADAQEYLTQRLD